MPPSDTVGGMIVMAGWLAVALMGSASSGQSPAEPRLDAEARAELSRMFAHAPANRLKLRNVRRVMGSVCGEVSLEATGGPPAFVLFTYRPGRDAAMDRAPGPRLAADGARCPVRDRILAVCAPTAAERRQAELRSLRCEAAGPL